MKNQYANPLTNEEILGIQEEIEKYSKKDLIEVVKDYELKDSYSGEDINFQYYNTMELRQKVIDSLNTVYLDNLEETEIKADNKEEKDNDE